MRISWSLWTVGYLYRKFECLVFRPTVANQSWVLKSIKQRTNNDKPSWREYFWLCRPFVQWELPGSENGGTMPYKAVFILGIIWSYIALNYIDIHRPYIYPSRFLKWPLICYSTWCSIICIELISFQSTFQFFCVPGVRDCGENLMRKKSMLSDSISV